MTIPTIITRAEWGPEHGVGLRTPGKQSRVVFHHAPERILPARPTRAQIIEQVRIIEDWHAKTLTPTNPRIGYHWIVVEQTGDIVEGLGWDRIGAHVANQNTASLGILLLGLNGAQRSGSVEAWDSIAWIVREGIRRGSLVNYPELAPHRKYVATECPGDQLAAYVRALTFDELIDRTPTVLEFPDPRPPAIEVQPAAPPRVPLEGLDLTRIETPRRHHVDEVLRVRRLTPKRIEDGIAVAEVVLRGVMAARSGDAREVVKGAADAFADWLKARL